MKNPSLAVLVLNKDCRVIATSYEKDAYGNGVAPFTLFKTLNPNIAVGDLAVVPAGTRHGFTIVRVEAVGVEWDPETTDKIDWLVDRVDQTTYRQDAEKEQRAISLINAAEKRKKREDMMASVTEHLNAQEVESLQITHHKAEETQAAV